MNRNNVFLEAVVWIVTAAMVVTCNPDLEEITCLSHQDCDEGFICSLGSCVLNPEDAGDDAHSDAEVTLAQCAIGESWEDDMEIITHRAIFVNSNTGRDLNDGTPTAPLATLGAAAARVTDNQNIIILAVGSYDWVPVPFKDHQCLEIRGGYAPGDAWIESGQSTITSDTDPVLMFEDVEQARLSDLIIQAPQGRIGSHGYPDEEALLNPALTLDELSSARAGETIEAIVAIRTTLTIRDSTVQSGDGGDGGIGWFGIKGDPGETGSHGDISTSVCGQGTDCDLAGEGASADDCWSEWPGQISIPEIAEGGAGGDGGTATDGPEPGEAGGSIDGEEGANGGTAESIFGETGAPGEEGRDGNGGAAYGYVRNGLWHPIAGASGGFGDYGRGGGGGVGFYLDNGVVHVAGGGGGGGGGCGGMSGGGGGGGGGSIAVLLDNATLYLEASSIHAADGGDGGAGGPGGSGGSGGEGGQGGGFSETIGGAGDGGTGGVGGAGGYGGGGAGGISVAVLLVGESYLYDTNNNSNLESGDPGEGGESRGSFGFSSGSTGFAGEQLYLPLSTSEICPYGSEQLFRWGESETELYCMQRYEVSEASVALGVAEPVIEAHEQPISAPDVEPWIGVTFWEAANSCARAGGYICDAGIYDDACDAGRGFSTLDADDCNFEGSLQPTGSFSECRPDGIEIYDLLGNAAEWYDIGDYSQEEQVAYGGSYADAPGDVQCGFNEVRSADAPDGVDDVGFRCCFVPSELFRTEFLGLN